MNNPHLCYPATTVAVAQGWGQARRAQPLLRTARGPCPLSGGTALAWPLQRDTSGIGITIPDMAGWRLLWHHPGPFPPHYGIPRSCPTAPTCVLRWQEARWLVGVQGRLLHRGHPLWKCRGREAAVLAGVHISLVQCVLLRLEQRVLLGSVPCRETTCGKVLVSLTQASHQPCTP